ncbi:alpha/beta hydrolase [Pseudomaricurvus alkylphenolicus]|uniref:alpha/beta hydrolase n=1 Tax=Pseudomaricurvus alkylphenolicus TaxID=1306991 RepID=UPI00141F1E75|nr:alpha/beta hydrolase [Pseudomaricurvus alkylphenolicus]NIB38886.1 alpha/beta hydrolase [Pseudomaricurvus alkylphenolicus]
MASLRSKLTNTLVRVFMRLRPTSGSLQDFCRQYDRLDARKRGKLAPGVTRREINDPLNGRWLEHANSDRQKVILYLHGGAFIMRLPESHSQMVSRLCDLSGRSAFLPWYRLAPDHPFPAALEDCLAAYQYLLRNHSPDQIVVMGDSAGANLTLCLLNMIKQKQLPMPSAAVALSPITDFSQISATWMMHSWRDPMFPIQSLVSPQQHYLQGEHLRDALASPVFGDLKQLPPTLLVVGGDEALRDDSLVYTHKALEAGVDIQLHIWQGMPHVHMLMDFLPEAALAEKAVVRWLAELPRRPQAALSAWRHAVHLFNRKPISGQLQHQINGEAVYNPTPTKPTGTVPCSD